MEACYICHEPTAETCQCTCEATVHADCLLKSVQRSGKPVCTICRGAIRNVRACAQRRLSRYVVCFATALGATTFMSCLAALILLALAVEEERMNVFYDLVVCCGTSVVIAMLASSFLQKLLDDHVLVYEHVEYKYVQDTAFLASGRPSLQPLRYR